MDPLASRRLGLTQVEVTQLGFGGAGLGDLFEIIPEAQAAATLQAAWDAGIRYYDTAPWYGLTQSEHRFGRALYRQPRRDFVLSTKVGRTMHAVHHAETYDRGIWSGGLPFEVRFDYSYDGVMRSFEDSLQRLGLPRIDLLLIHDLDIQYHQTCRRVEALLTELHNGGARALAELKAAGRIGGFGAGINELGMIPRFLDLIDVDFFLVAFALHIARSAGAGQRIPALRRKGDWFRRRRGVRLGHPRDRRGAGRALCLFAGDAGDADESGAHRGGMRAPRRADRGGGVAIPARAIPRSRR